MSDTMAIARDVIGVEGADAERFLQGQLSNDVAVLAVGGSCWSFILQPQGKVDALVRVLRLAADRFVIDVDAGYGDGVMRRLQRFLLRTKATVAPMPWGCSVCFEPAATGDGHEVAGWPGVAMTVRLGPSLPVGPAVLPAHHEQERVAAGWPAMGAELTEATIPGETGVVAFTVSFTKGCYTGQELVARVDSRGNNVPRHLRHLLAAGLRPGERISVDGVDVGWVTSATPTLALGYVGRAVEPGAVVLAGATAAEVRAIAR